MSCIFTLKNIDLEKIKLKYGLNITHEQSVIGAKTYIEDIEKISKHDGFVSFVDESKRQLMCKLTTINFQSDIEYKCRWCRHMIDSHYVPIGCPIKYVADKAVKKYLSAISKESYTISEPISKKKKENVPKNIEIEEKNYYETEGIFCSFNCCVAYIKSPEIRNNPKYKYSFILLYQMYEEVQGTEKKDIIPAPHWLLLKENGGHLTIKEFRESFNRIEYVYQGVLKFSDIGNLYEDRIKF